MNTLIIVLVLVGSLMTTYGLTDKEIEKVKQLVDAELLKRELDVILTKPQSTGEPKTARATGRKSAKTLETTSKTTTEHPDHGLQYSIDNCLDMYGTKKCKVLINDWKMSCDKDRMEEMCEKSCGYCGLHINPLVNCATSEFGCCADALSTRKDPFGSNCPVCKDKIPGLCINHSPDCNEVGMVGEWMRSNCEKTCQVCSPVKGNHVANSAHCTDDPEQHGFCKAWKDEGLCTQIPDMMRAHCAATCEMCQ